MDDGDAVAAEGLVEGGAELSVTVVSVNRCDAPVRCLAVSNDEPSATLVVFGERRLAYPHGADAEQRAINVEAMRLLRTETTDFRRAGERELFP
jgi:hypothetical protein